MDDRAEHEAHEAVRERAEAQLALENDAELRAARHDYHAAWVRAGRNYRDKRAFLGALREEQPYDADCHRTFEAAAAKLRVQARAKSLVQALYALERKNRIVKDALRSPAALGHEPYLQPLVDNGVHLDEALRDDFADALASRDGDRMASAARDVLNKLADLARDYRPPSTAHANGHRRVTIAEPK